MLCDGQGLPGGQAASAGKSDPGELPGLCGFAVPGSQLSIFRLPSLGISLGKGRKTLYGGQFQDEQHR